jgi:hypothetical protein
MDPRHCNAFYGRVRLRKSTARLLLRRSNNLGKEGRLLLSRKLSVVVSALLLAGPASAIPVVYTAIAGSKMTMVNQACNPNCSVPITGTVALEDNGGGTVTLTGMSLAHAPYQVGLPGFLSVVLERTSITLDAGPVAGPGSTLTSVVLGPTSIAQVGTVTCTSGFLNCGGQGLTEGSVPMASPIPVNLGTWNFTDSGTNLSAVFTYFSVPSQATETLTLVATIPEPATALLVSGGLLGLALRRRAKV